MTPSDSGSIPNAIYGESQLEEYQSNPLISCLPPIYPARELVKHLQIKPNFESQERLLDGRIRAHAIARLLHSFFQPLNHHLELESKFSLMIRCGYLGRNPEAGDYYSHLQNGYQRIMKGDLSAVAFKDVGSTASSLSLFGCSGCGKSRAIERILSMYPQAINHPEYNIVQLPYIKIDCPIDGDLNALCLSFFNAVDRVLGTRYTSSHGRKKLGTSTLLANMCQIANLHALGVLIIDETQNLSEAKSGGAEKMHNFFVTLVNTIGVPVVQVGTYKAREFFKRTFRAARRISELGSLQWDRLPKDKQWNKLLDRLWQYQWLQNPEPLDDQLRETLYDLTQGVMDVLIKLYVLGQMRAIVTGAERLNPAILQQVHDEELKPVHPMLSALKSNNAEKIAKYSDLVTPDIEIRLLEMAARIDATIPVPSPPAEVSDDKSKRLLSLAGQLEIPLDIAIPMVEDILCKHPDLSITALVNKLTQYSVGEEPERPAFNRVKQAEWRSLPHHDLRYIHSMADPQDVHSEFVKQGLIFDLSKLIA